MMLSDNFCAVINISLTICIVILLLYYCNKVLSITEDLILCFALQRCQQKQSCIVYKTDSY